MPLVLLRHVARIEFKVAVFYTARRRKWKNLCPCYDNFMPCCLFRSSLLCEQGIGSAVGALFLFPSAPPTGQFVPIFERRHPSGSTDGHHSEVKEILQHAVLDISLCIGCSALNIIIMPYECTALCISKCCCGSSPPSCNLQLQQVDYFLYLFSSLSHNEIQMHF